MPAPDLARYLGMLVRDSDGLALGRVEHTALDPATLDLRNIVVGLAPHARDRAGVPASGLALPVQLISAMGPDAIVLGIALDEIRRDSRGCWLIRPAPAPPAA